MAEKWLADRSSVSPNLVSDVLGTAAFSGDKALYDKLLAAFKASTNRQDRTRLIGALAGFRDRAAIEAGYNALVSGEVPAIEGFALLLAGQGNPTTRKMPLEYLRSHWDAVLARLPVVVGGFDMRGNLPNVGASFCDAASRDELRALLQPHVDTFIGARRNLDQVTERIDQCIANKAAQEASVASFLTNY
jgi:alanyl aminopeptidase